MLCLERNKVPFWYCLYLGRGEVEHNGVGSGEYSPEYAPPVMYMANVSDAEGSTHVQNYGTDIDYNKVITIEDASLPITESTVLFVDKEPEFDEDGNPLYDYIVRRVMISRNSGMSLKVYKVR